MRRSKLQEIFAKEDLEMRREFIKAAMTHEAGRAFIWWLLQIGKALGGQPFAHNALVMSFGCGEMQVGNQVLNELIAAVPRGLPDLMVEQATKADQRKQRLDSAAPDDSPEETD